MPVEGRRSGRHANRADHLPLAEVSAPVHDRLDRITTRAESDPAATFGNVFSLLKDWFRSQLTTPISIVWPTLVRKLQGHFQYFNVNDNWKLLMKYREAACRMGLRWMRRRSHKGRHLSWEAYGRYLEHHPLPTPGQITGLIAMARAQ